MVYIYVLELVDGKYYIGKTNTPGFRIEQHFLSGGSEWTKKYRPISIIEVINDCDDYDEDKYTRKYMDKYGIDNVRGGSFCQEILDEYTTRMLQKMSDSTKNKCFVCGLSGHFAKDCKGCEQLEDMDKCLTAIDSFIKEKRMKEIVDPKYEKPSPDTPFGYSWGTYKDSLLQKEKDRAKNQKERNDEFLPVIEIIMKSLQMLDEKVKSPKVITDLFNDIAKQQGISINKDAMQLLSTFFT